MTLSIDDFLFRRQLLQSELAVVTQHKTEAQNSLEHFISTNSSLRAQRDQGRTRRIAASSSCEPSAAANGERWITPAPRIAHAFRLWREEEFSRHLFTDSSPRLRTAMVVGGGVGDHLKASAIIPVLLRMLDCDMYYITANRPAIEIFRCSPYVKCVMLTRRNPHELAEEALFHLPFFDLIVTWKYAVEFVVPTFSRLPPETAEKLTTASNDRAEDFRRYYYPNEIWPKFNNAFGRAMMRRGLRAHDVSSFTAFGAVADDDALTFFPDRLSIDIVDALCNRPYITIHHGFDLNHLGKKLIETSYGSTKNISIALWTEIVAAIRAAGVDVIQLGAVNEDEIPGTTRNLNGQTTLSETALILKNSICHIDTEGGLVHLARAVRTRSVVLFGPTPVEVFGYPQNINIEPSTCKACWFTATNWVVQCPRLTAGPQCAEEHRADRVIAAVNEILAGVPVVTAEILGKVVVAEADDVPEFLSRDAMRDHLNNLSINEALFIGEQLTPPLLAFLRSGRSSAFSALVASDVPGHKVDIESVSESLQRDGILPSSIFNIPRDSSSIDLVVCRSAIWSSCYGPRALREMIRILQPGGVLAVWPSQIAGKAEVGELDISRLLVDAGLAGHANSVLPRTSGAVAFVIKKQISSVRQYPVIRTSAEQEDATLCGGMRRGVSTTPAPLDLGGRSTWDLEVERIALGNEELIFDTYRYYLHRKHVNDDIWSNKNAIINATRREGGWISTSSDFCDEYAHFFTLKGWYTLETWGVWGAGRRHTLMLPLADAGGPKGDVAFEAAIELPMIGLVPQQTVKVIVAGEVLDVWNCRTRRETRSIRIPALYVPTDAVLELEFQIDRCIVPSRYGLSKDDHREIGLGLHEFRYGYATGEPKGC